MKRKGGIVIARPPSARIQEIRRKLRVRLQEGIYRPGDGFLSARQTADIFGISYQTAHRLLDELCNQGLLERRAGSGTYLPGGVVDFQGVQLIFNARARRENSFGWQLLTDLKARLEKDHISWKLAWTDQQFKVSLTRFPVLWEAPAAMRHCAEKQLAALLLNDRPTPGLEATLIDSVSIDDYSGGAAAAQLMLKKLTVRTRKHDGEGRKSSQQNKRFAVLTGPEADTRSNQRRDGFKSVLSGARVVASPTWFFEDGYKVAKLAVQAGQDGIFCCNDRLAEAVIRWCNDGGRPVPPLIGFDNAPIAESLNFTTIALPRDEMVAGAVECIKKRLAGSNASARQLILTPRPVIRQ